MRHAFWPSIHFTTDDTDHHGYEQEEQKTNRSQESSTNSLGSRNAPSARRSGELAQKRYDSGYVNLLEVIDAQRTVLTTERASAQLAAQRLTNSVSLIKSIGGTWTSHSQPVAILQ